MSERLEFVRRWEEGERVVDLCHEFGISRKTAYKLRERYEQFGARALFDRSHAPRTIPHRTPPEVEKVLMGVREEHPTWRPKKIRAYVLRQQPGLAVPCASTIGDVLKRNGVIVRKRRRRSVMPRGAPLRVAERPNEIWCADFKGEFRLGVGRYCYPLTITDRFSRYLLRCEALEGTHVDTAITVFDQAFREYGLPLVIRTDNGGPFAAPGLWGLSRLSARWPSTRHLAGADRALAPRTKWAARKDAPRAEGRDDPPRRGQLPPAARNGSTSSSTCTTTTDRTKRSGKTRLQTST